jgi:Sulfatase-modifying factor enzyme 1
LRSRPAHRARGSWCPAAFETGTAAVAPSVRSASSDRRDCENATDRGWRSRRRQRSTRLLDAGMGSPALPGAHWVGPLGVCVWLCCCEVLAPVDDVNMDASVHEARPSCHALPTTEGKSVVSGAGPDWTAVLVNLSGTRDAIYMDETEVTVGEYQSWVDGDGLSFTDWHTWCQWKKSGASNPAKTPQDECVRAIPSGESAPFVSDKPVRCVDWCYAEAFCRVARGGHLCYDSAIGGSVLPEDTANEWLSACDNGGATAWPWGNEQDPTLCNLGQQSVCGAGRFSCGPVPVRSFAACHNANGNYDLIGNVDEWLGNCEAIGADSPDGGCITAGGNYDDVLEHLSCARLPRGPPKSTRSPRIGFRCCYELLPIERQMCGLP